MLENRNTVTIEELAGLLGWSPKHMGKLVENDRLAYVNDTAPIRSNRPRPVSRRERFD